MCIGMSQNQLKDPKKHNLVSRKTSYIGKSANQENGQCQLYIMTTVNLFIEYTNYIKFNILGLEQNN